MAFLRTAVFLIFSILSVSMFIQEGNATRPLGMAQWTSPLLASLPRGGVPSSGGSKCTYIPGGGSKGPCPLNEKHFAGGAAHARSASHTVIDIVSASVEIDETSNKDSTS
ncbi:Hypothetical predicted protein [Olea europaea subsp. europaea]|uniref:Uncharacterized protein n=1 Tax=Olea europaea subsp. europaea TaxID=158383 RepID=A0A8S0UI11_OLEEU|nr:Hypothetical predicted protein [Olea europaea subsp. europaea]